MVNPARLRAIAIGGTRGRGNINGPGKQDNDMPSGMEVVTRLTTDPKGGTSKYSFPKNQVTPGKWTTKSKIGGKK